MKGLTIIWFSVLMLAAYSSQAGGPWVLAKKKGFFQIQATIPIGSYSRLFHRDGIASDIHLHRGVTDTHLQAYLEYGLTNKLTIVTTLPFKYVETSSDLNSGGNSDFNEALNAGSLSGIGNASFALKHQVINKKWVGSVSAKYEFNSARTNLNKGLATGYQANALSSFVHLGKSFKGDAYFFTEMGGTIRENDYSDEWQVSTEVGKKVKTLWTAFVLDYKRSLRNGNKIDPSLDQTGLYTNNQEYFAFGFKVAKEFENGNGINLSSFGAFSGHNVAHLATVNIGWFKKW